MLKSVEGRWIMLILAAALLARLSAAVWWQARIPSEALFLLPDSESYWHLARTIAHGQPYEYGGPTARVFRMPGYPLSLAPVVGLFGDGYWAVAVARTLGALCGTVAVALTMVWAGRLFGKQEALIAGLVTACYPGVIAISIVVLSEALFCPLMLAQLVCWTLAEQASRPLPRLAWAGAAGAATGSAILVRPSWLLFLPLAGFLSLLVPGDRIRRVGLLAVMALVAVVPLLPWWVRNYRLTGHFVPTTLQVGASLYDGWNPQATGASNMEFTARFYRQLRDDELAGRWRGRSFEYELDARMRRAAMDWAAEHPAAAARLAVAKLARLWNVWPNDDQFRSRALRLVVAATYVPCLLLALLSVPRLWHAGWPAGLCLMPALYVTVLHVVFVSSIRYREPAMFGLIVAGAALLSRLVGKRIGPSGESRPS
jgi:4-amino-4-deoxy-L-arabinose transferase-like glycosyltransferase